MKRQNFIILHKKNVFLFFFLFSTSVFSYQNFSADCKTFSHELRTVHFLDDFYKGIPSFEYNLGKERHDALQVHLKNHPELVNCTFKHYETDDTPSNILLELLEDWSRQSWSDGPYRKEVLESSEARIRFWLSHKPGLGLRNGIDFSPILLASHINAYKIPAFFYTLLEMGSDINDHSKYGMGVLRLCLAKYCPLPLLEELLRLGADPNFGGGPHLIDQSVMFTLSWYSNSLKKLKLLINYGGNIELRDEFGNTPLIEAAAACDYPYVRNLIRVGASIEARDHYGKSALEKVGKRRRHWREENDCKKTRDLLALDAEIRSLSELRLFNIVKELGP